VRRLHSLGSPPPDITAETLNCPYASVSQVLLLPPRLPLIFLAPPWTVHLALAHSKTNAMGFDGIPPWFARLAGPFIVPTLAYLYNLSFRLSVVPVQRKNATITPVHKVAVPVKPADYRPIFVLPLFSTIYWKSF